MRTKLKKALKRAAILGIILAVAVWAWKVLIEDHVIAKRWGTVEEGCIYRSGQLSSSLVRRMLQSNGIKVIISLTGELQDDPDQQAQAAAVKELGIQHRRFPLRGDGTGDINMYAGAIAAIAEARRTGKPVLIHCGAGAQRTGGAVAFYRLLVENKSPSFVITEMAGYGWDPECDANLIDYINAHLSELGAKLTEMKVIEEVPKPLPLLSVPGDQQGERPGIP